MGESAESDPLAGSGEELKRAAEAGADEELAAEASAEAKQGVQDGVGAANVSGSPIRGLLVDWGGVMTTNLFRSFSDFCEQEGLDSGVLVQLFRGSEQARELLIGFEEGRVEEARFEAELGSLLGLDTADGLIDRLFSGATLEPSMVDAVRAARAAGIATGLISNSWGTSRYPRELLGELFDGVVISGEVGIRKPAPRIYELGAQAITRAPEECVFIDDLPFNLPPATELGMATVHHTAADTTIPELERLLGLVLQDVAI